jgi:hypothetical protein
MFRFDRVVVAPSREELERTLTAAAVAANQDATAGLLTWRPANTDALLAKVAVRPEGIRQWNAKGTGEEYGIGDMRSAVAVAWWNDPLKRAHYRIVADRVFRGEENISPGFGAIRKILSAAEQYPPLALVYPHDIYFREEDDDLWITFAVCHCGAADDPDALGWMGPHCAACHDRAEAGEPPLVPPDSPARLLCHSPDAGATMGRLSFGPDGRSLIAHGRFRSGIRVWDLKSGEAQSPTPHKGYFDAVAVSPDGETAAGGLLGRKVVLWSLRDGRTFRTLETDADVPANWPGSRLSLAFSPDGGLLGVAFFDRVEVWEVSSARRRAIVANGLPASSRPRPLAFSPDGGTLAVALDEQGGVLLWDVAGYGRNLIAPHARSVADLAFSPDGRKLGVADVSRSGAFLWDRQTATTHFLPKADHATDLAISPNGRFLAVVCNDGAMRLYGAEDGRRLASFLRYGANFSPIAISPDSRWLAFPGPATVVKCCPIEAFLPRER